MDSKEDTDESERDRNPGISKCYILQTPKEWIQLEER
jgi:hypothetical protein